MFAAARRLDRLEKLAEETGCIPVQLDVRNRAAVMAFGKEQPVDILVNNAGLGRALARGRGYRNHSGDQRHCSPHHDQGGFTGDD